MTPCIIFFYLPKYTASDLSEYFNLNTILFETLSCHIDAYCLYIPLKIDLIRMEFIFTFKFVGISFKIYFY